VSQTAKYFTLAQRLVSCEFVVHVLRWLIAPPVRMVQLSKISGGRGRRWNSNLPAGQGAPALWRNWGAALSRDWKKCSSVVLLAYETVPARQINLREWWLLTRAQQKCHVSLQTIGRACMNSAKEGENNHISLQFGSPFLHMMQRVAGGISPVDLKHRPSLQFLCRDLLEGWCQMR
jgi:hypothetical protein